MDETIKEAAKATQEIAKTSSVAIKATERLGSFLSKLIGEPAEIAIGVLSDRLKFMRWERQLRLAEKIEEIISERNLNGKTIPVPPKLAIPIIENATLEDDDSLQDIWANLLATAMSPKRPAKIKSSFIEIVKQLDPEDAKILKKVYELFLSKKENKRGTIGFKHIAPTDIPISRQEVIESISPFSMSLERTLDNLYRLRCLTPFSLINDINEYQIYDEFSMTYYGVAFVEACIV